MAVMQVGWQAVGYATAGDAGDPVLLLHGTLMSKSAFDGVRAAMPADASYRFVSIDFPGSGESPQAAEPLTVEALAAQAHGLMRELGHERYHVAGFSLGAVVAAGLAGTYPQSVRTVSLLAGWITADARMRATFELWRQLITADPRVFARYVLVDGFTADFNAVVAPMIDGVLDLFAASIAPGFAAQLDLDIALDITELLANVTAPTLIIGGSEDRWVDVKHSHSLGQAIAGSRVEVLPSGHMMVSEQPAQVSALLYPHLAAN